MELKDLIRQYQERTGFNKATIAKEAGVSKATVGRWVSGEVTKLQSETAERLSRLLGFDVEAFLESSDVDLKRPILGITKAGYDLFLEENYQGEVDLTYEDYRKGDYFLRVSGDSMIGAGIVDGALIYVRKCEKIASGKIAVVQVGDEVTVKRVIYKDQTMILEAANPTVANRYLSKREIEDLPVRILGEVLYSRIDF